MRIAPRGFVLAEAAQSLNPAFEAGLAAALRKPLAVIAPAGVAYCPQLVRAGAHDEEPGKAGWHGRRVQFRPRDRDQVRLQRAAVWAAAEGGAAIRTPCTPDRWAASAARYGGAGYAREPPVTITSPPLPFGRAQAPSGGDRASRGSGARGVRSVRPRLWRTL